MSIIGKSYVISLGPKIVHATKGDIKFEFVKADGKLDRLQVELKLNAFGKNLTITTDGSATVVTGDMVFGQDIEEYDGVLGEALTHAICMEYGDSDGSDMSASILDEGFDGHRWILSAGKITNE